MMLATGILFITKGICISVTWNKRCYFLFDSHSCNLDGKVSADGSLVVIKLLTRKLLQEITICYLFRGNTDNVQFEVRYNLCKYSNGKFSRIRRG